jgi:hypothetical protein
MRIFAACLLVVLAPLGHAQQRWSFEGRPYYDSLIAGVREPHISALIPAFFDRMDFMLEQDERRLGVDVDVGAELPIFGRETAASAGQIGEGESGWGIWIPIDFHTLQDFRDESLPIVNTDYRYGVMIKYRKGFRNSRWIAARVHIGHESTHLGDEFSIKGQRRYPATFERINVSWEYVDLGVLYEWHTARKWNVRAGATMRVPPNESYYSVGPGSVTESRIGPVTESKNWLDPYAGLEVLFEGVCESQWDIYASSELRWRSVYDYHKADADDAEERQPSVNVIAGVKKTGIGRGFGRVSPFVRFYYGVNPHGQFRNQKSYTEAGFGVRLVR